MRINFHKSELIPINIEPEELHHFIEIFQCEKGSILVLYLGILLHHDRLRREDLLPLIESILKRTTGWRGKLCSTDAKRVLVKLVYLAFLFTYSPSSNSLDGI
jgi:hypothetical protein